jgi:hypothetical protein
LETWIWDHLPLLGVGTTAQVRRAGRWVLKVAHPGPEARARLAEEARLTRRLEREGFAVPRVLGSVARGRALVRERLEGGELGRDLTPQQLRELFKLWQRVQDFERRTDLRLDFRPPNVRWKNGRVWLLDAGLRRRGAIFTARTSAELEAQWRAWFARGKPLRLEPRWFPPSGQFHVETKVGRDRGAKVLWLNRPLLKRLGLTWNEGFVEQLAGWSTQARPTTTRVSTRYVDMFQLNRRFGPHGDGRSIHLSALPQGELTVKGCGPTPLAWHERRYHGDGRVSFPRTLWEAATCDELARLGFELTQYVAVLSAGATTADNTHRRWPAALGLRLSRTHDRIGHLRQWVDRPERLAAMLKHCGSRLVRPDFDPSRESHRVQWLKSFARTLGEETGRTDLLQAHCFHPTPGNVRLDGHLIDFQTVRFFRHYLPDFPFMQGAFRVRMVPQLGARALLIFCEVLGLKHRLRAARRLYDRAYDDGFRRELARFYGCDASGLPRNVVPLSRALRALRGDGVVTLKTWHERCPAPLFDFLGRAPDFVKAVRRGHAEPWRALLWARGEPDAAARRLADRWAKAIAPALRRPGRAWSQVVRPFMEADALATLCEQRSTPRHFAAWKRAVASQLR